MQLLRLFSSQNNATSVGTIRNGQESDDDSDNENDEVWSEYDVPHPFYSTLQETYQTSQVRYK